MIKEQYRADYEGEFVVTESKWINGKKTQNREWIKNPIINQHVSGRAVCIASNIDKKKFDYKILERHRGGLLGSKKVQTYGTGVITKETRLDFAVEIDKQNIAEILDRKYSTDNIVYTTTRNCLSNPGEFYMIPYNTLMATEALLLWLAAFDGHKEIFMIGYNNFTPGSVSEWMSHVNTVIGVFPSVTFTLVGIESVMPREWRKNANVKCLSQQDFIHYCDV
jgi:hypothetical protein|tara:strand:- start:6298 stop:6963 length:666 start_codon:yes stop_codon:yes gene_type:complete